MHLVVSVCPSMGLSVCALTLEPLVPCNFDIHLFKIEGAFAVSLAQCSIEFFLYFSLKYQAVPNMDEESGEGSQPSAGEGIQSPIGDITQLSLEDEPQKTSAILPNAEKCDVSLQEPDETPQNLEEPLAMSQETHKSNITSMGPHELTTGLNDSTAELHNSCETNLVLPVHREPNEQAQRDSQGLFEATHEPDNIPHDLQESSVMESQAIPQNFKENQDSTAALEVPIESPKDVQEPQGDGCEPLVKLQQPQAELLGPQIELGPEPNEMLMDPSEIQEKLPDPEELHKTSHSKEEPNVSQDEMLKNLEQIHEGQRDPKEPIEKLPNPTANYPEPQEPPDIPCNLQEHSPVEQELHEHLDGENPVIVNVQETNSMPKSTQSPDLTLEDPNTVLQDPPGPQIESQEPHSEDEPCAEVPGLQDPPDTNTLVNDPTEAQEPSVGLEESQEGLENPQEPGNTRIEPVAIHSHAAGGELQEPDNLGIFKNLFYWQICVY